MVLQGEDRSYIEEQHQVFKGLLWGAHLSDRGYNQHSELNGEQIAYRTDALRFNWLFLWKFEISKIGLSITLQFVDGYHSTA